MGRAKRPKNDLPPGLRELEEHGLPGGWHRYWHASSSVSNRGIWMESEEASFTNARERERDFQNGRVEWKNSQEELHRIGGPAVISPWTRSVRFYENNEIVKDGRPATISSDDGTAGYWVGQDPLAEEGYGIYMHILCDGSQEWWTVDGLLVANKKRENGFMPLVLSPEYKDFFDQIEKDNSPEALLRKERIEEAVKKQKRINDLHPDRIDTDEESIITFEVGPTHKPFRDSSEPLEGNISVAILADGSQEWYFNEHECIRMVSPDGKKDTYLQKDVFREAQYDDEVQMKWITDIMNEYEKSPLRERVEEATEIQRGDEIKQKSLNEYNEAVLSALEKRQ